MKIKLSMLLITMLSTNAMAVETLGGDAGTACQVILCLSSPNGRGLSECKEPLRRYFRIQSTKWYKTVQKRRSFLDLCPSADESSKNNALNHRY